MSSSTSLWWIRRVRGDVSVIAAVALGFGAVQAYPFAGAANAAVISPGDAQSWIDGQADGVPVGPGLYNDTLPAATVADSNLLTKNQPTYGALGQAYTWGSSTLRDSRLTDNFPADEYNYNGVTYGTFVYNIAALAEAK